jgi:rare lipoprotein A
VQYGIASWYGGRNQGRLIASGVRFDEYAMVAAHRTLPLGTRVSVTNLRNGRSVVVRILDRGPYIVGRAIDLSLAAASALGFTERGLAPVRIRVISDPPCHPPSTPPRCC